MAQPTTVTESVEVSGQNALNLDFAFADKIVLKTWDKQEVLVEVQVEINDGEHNDIFSLSSSKSDQTIYVKMDEDMWDKIDRGDRKKYCNWQSNIDYTVYLPVNLEVKSKTISGDYEFEYFGTPVRLKTISGEIDVTVPDRSSFDFNAETISGEMFTNLDIKFPYGKEGLNQIVGQKVKRQN